mmetsp:Transcript_4628/g.12953  ORF Transcript_4628/g.12953 Transcript_4628/m.12953 type:complete len:109 (-) Transcript_4628:84-410(-)
MMAAKRCQHDSSVAVPRDRTGAVMRYQNDAFGGSAMRWSAVARAFFFVSRSYRQKFSRCASPVPAPREAMSPSLPRSQRSSPVVLCGVCSLCVYVFFAVDRCLTSISS